MKQRKKGGASKQGEKYVRRSRGRKEEVFLRSIS
jgi:hypothetical protein